MIDPKKDIGADDAPLTRVFGNVAETIGARISHSLQHTAIEPYAPLFQLGVRTPMPTRPSDVGLDKVST